MHPSKTKLMLTKRFFLFLLHPLQLKREFPAQLRFGEHIPHSQPMGEWERDSAHGLAAAGKWQIYCGPKATVAPVHRPGCPKCISLPGWFLPILVLCPSTATCSSAPAQPHAPLTNKLDFKEKESIFLKTLN